MAITGATDLGRGLLALTVDTDPSVVAVDCAAGCMIIYVPSGVTYTKLDDGPTTNVSRTAPARGTGTIDFGAFPGSTDAALVVTGQALILAGSVVQAWVVGAATAEHSVDEHFAEAPAIVAGSIVPGVGFTIYAAAPGAFPLYGQYSVGWSWA